MVRSFDGNQAAFARACCAAFPAYGPPDFPTPLKSVARRGGRRV
jgi:hypothetical protein